jgi:hypothetical protein
MDFARALYDPQAIWDSVLQDEAEPQSATAKDALAAVKRGDVAACARLSARCFKEAGCGSDGANALAAADTEVRNSLWLSIVDPLVVNIPGGQDVAEKLKLRTVRLWRFHIW